jgi:plasmid stabilization system protein ParE
VRYRVVIQPRAERDIEAAADWILEQSGSPAVALRWARGIRASIATLKDKPLRCPVAADSDAYGEEVRVLLHGTRRGQYRVLFAVRGDAVQVLTVRHSARRREALRSEDLTDEELAAIEAAEVPDDYVHPDDKLDG